MRDADGRDGDARIQRDGNAIFERHELDVVQAYELVPRSVRAEKLAHARHGVNADRMRAEDFAAELRQAEVVADVSVRQ